MCILHCLEFVYGQNDFNLIFGTVVCKEGYAVIGKDLLAPPPKM